MNIDKLKLAKEIVLTRPDGVNFDMNRIYTESENSACIAGLCLIYEHGLPYKFGDSDYKFAEFLECEPIKAWQIMYPDNFHLHQMGAEFPHGLSCWTVDHALLWLDHWISVFEAKDAR